MILWKSCLVLPLNSVFAATNRTRRKQHAKIMGLIRKFHIFFWKLEVWRTSFRSFQSWLANLEIVVCIARSTSDWSPIMHLFCRRWKLWYISRSRQEISINSFAFIIDELILWNSFWKIGIGSRPWPDYHIIFLFFLNYESCSIFAFCWQGVIFNLLLITFVRLVSEFRLIRLHWKTNNSHK